MKKYYYVVAELGDGMPSYDFVLRELNLDEAKEHAENIIDTDYPEYNCVERGKYSVHEVTAQQLLGRMIIN